MIASSWHMYALEINYNFIKFVFFQTKQMQITGMNSRINIALAIHAASHAIKRDTLIGPRPCSVHICFLHLTLTEPTTKKY